MQLTFLGSGLLNASETGRDIQAAWVSTTAIAPSDSSSHGSTSRSCSKNATGCFFSSFCPDGRLKRINDPRASDWRTTQHVFRGQATGFSCEIWRTKTKTDPSGTSKELIASGYSFLDSQKRSGRALRSYDWFIIYIQPRPTVDTSTITPSYCILVSSQHC